MPFLPSEFLLPFPKPSDDFLEIFNMIERAREDVAKVVGIDPALFKPSPLVPRPTMQITHSYMGYRIIEDVRLVDMVEDWSGCRSPSRARRRAAQGHRQRMVIIAKPKTDVFVIEETGTIVMHPDMAREIDAKILGQ